MRYRADIDGLRTVAVIPVVLYHAGIAGFSGGFVGVDIFFVISGFLITNVIQSDLEKQQFSIINFYERRIRRIFPALVVVFATSLAIGYFLQRPNEFSDMALSIVAASFFVSNIFFWKSTNYFATESIEAPMLHTWSLAVEEQFYIFFPLLLIVLARTNFRKIPLLTAIAVVSFIGASVLVFYKQSATFYLLPTRAWELLIGALLALGIVPEIKSVQMRKGAAFLGVLLIIVPIFTYTEKTVFPGIAALPPTIGAALIIWSGTMGGGFVHQLLSSRPFTLCGQASYSLYLWHFPLLAFAIYARGGELSTFEALVVCALSLVLSLLSLKFVERPFRKRRSQIKGRSFAVPIAVSGLLLVTISSYAIYAYQGMPSRLDDRSAKFVRVSDDETRHPKSCMSLDNVIVDPGDACLMGDRSTAPKTLLWGDSHAMVTATSMNTAAVSKNQSFLFAATADCPPGADFAIRPTSELTSSQSYQFCNDYNAKMLELAINDNGIQTVVLSSRWTNWRIGEAHNPAEGDVEILLEDDLSEAKENADNRPIFIRGFTNLVEQLIAADKEVYIVGPLPEPVFNVPYRLYLQNLGLQHVDKNITLENYSERHAVILKIFAEISDKYPVKFIWPHEALCVDDKCPIVDGNEAVFFDHNHLSVHSAEKIASIYEGVFDVSQ
ncbi:acyltransferase family protein [Parasphingorhabdus litoris]|uniref:Acyltransferase family protein n=1 Tax=Parasphingorhabdus litoris TaxID=394733 RepID=A0ABN1ARX2_9SPHN|nr:acyltransferase family protein [Parasphingorhabdus litoris]